MHIFSICHFRAKAFCTLTRFPFAIFDWIRKANTEKVAQTLTNDKANRASSGNRAIHAKIIFDAEHQLGAWKMQHQDDIFAREKCAFTSKFMQRIFVFCAPHFSRWTKVHKSAKTKCERDAMAAISDPAQQKRRSLWLFSLECSVDNDDNVCHSAAFAIGPPPTVFCGVMRTCTPFVDFCRKILFLFLLVHVSYYLHASIWFRWKTLCSLTFCKDYYVMYTFTNQLECDLIVSPYTTQYIHDRASSHKMQSPVACILNFDCSFCMHFTLQCHSHWPSFSEASTSPPSKSSL